MKKGGQPVPRAHVDYTVKSGPERLHALLPAEEASKLQKTPFAVIQVCPYITPLFGFHPGAYCSHCWQH